jgi:hypothetical protein
MHLWPTLFVWQNSRNPTKILSGISGYHGDEDIKVRIMFHMRASKEYLNLRNQTNECTCIKYVFIHAPLLVLLRKFKYTQVLIYQTTRSTSQKACHYEHSINKQTRLFGQWNRNVKHFTVSFIKNNDQKKMCNTILHSLHRHVFHKFSVLIANISLTAITDCHINGQYVHWQVRTSFLNINQTNQTTILLVSYVTLCNPKSTSKNLTSDILFFKSGFHLKLSRHSDFSYTDP